MRNLKYGTNEPICETETDPQIENRLVVVRAEERGSGMDGELGVGKCKDYI